LSQSVNLATWLAGGALVAAIFALIAAIAVGQRQSFPPEPGEPSGARPTSPAAGPAVATQTQATQVASRPLTPTVGPRPSTAGGTQQPITRSPTTPTTSAPEQPKEVSKPVAPAPEQPVSQANPKPTQPEPQPQEQKQPATTPTKGQYRPHAWGEKAKE
jgi:hypothetical protein